jgi:hypothetical protein
VAVAPLVPIEVSPPDIAETPRGSPSSRVEIIEKELATPAARTRPQLRAAVARPPSRLPAR